jgi:DNA-binding IclR family transcriptional regulator
VENTTVVHPTRAAILDYVRTCEHSPSLREIAQNVGVAAPSTVRMHLIMLERDGLVGFHGKDRRVYAVKQP